MRAAFCSLRSRCRCSFTRSSPAICAGLARRSRAKSPKSSTCGTSRSRASQRARALASRLNSNRGGIFEFTQCRLHSPRAASTVLRPHRPSLLRQCSIKRLRSQRRFRLRHPRRRPEPPRASVPMSSRSSPRLPTSTYRPTLERAKSAARRSCGFRSIRRGASLTQKSRSRRGIRDSI